MTAAAQEVPQVLLGQLAPGGILVVPVGAEYHDQQLIRVWRRESGYDTEELAWVRFVPLVAGLPRRSEKIAGDADEPQDDFVHDEFGVE